MLPIYNSEEIKKWDKFTITSEPISSIELMERAAKACVEWILNHINPECKIKIICGNGNNGGDGLAIGRLLLHYNYDVELLINNSISRSDDNLTNLKKIESYSQQLIKIIGNEGKMRYNPNDIIIDCIFGIGFKAPIDFFWQNVIYSINNSGCRIISIDLPSGLTPEPLEDFGILENKIVKATHTLTFQVPKLSLLLPFWGDFAGNFTIIDIGLHPNFIDINPSKFNYFTIDDARQKFIKRKRFSHKGNFGHALIIAGGEGKCGAAILSSKACIKSGAGLVSVFTHQNCENSIYVSCPEIMIENSDKNFDKYSAIGIGCGIGKEKHSKELVTNVLKNSIYPIVIDADAIGIAFEKNCKFPPNSILTPHPKEFDNIVGKSGNALERLKKAIQLAKQKNIIVVLKGANTAVCFDDGSVYFNSSGNQGMATAGSGDVLTGIITSFVAQGYSIRDAAIMGVFVHGLAGDLAASYNSFTGLSAIDIIDFLNPAFKELEN